MTINKEIISNNALLQSRNPLWENINSELSEIIDYVSEKNHPTAPYVNSLLEKYSVLANNDGECCNNDETTNSTTHNTILSHFLSQIYKVSPYIKTNAPVPRNFRFPIVS